MMRNIFIGYIPFCTHEGSRLSDTESKLKSACKGSTVLKGLAIRGAMAQNKREQARQSVKNWLGDCSSVPSETVTVALD